MDNTASPSPSPTKPPFQFTLRQLLLLTAVCSLTLAIIFHWGLAGYALFAVFAFGYGIVRGHPIWTFCGALMILFGLIFLPTDGGSRDISPKTRCLNNLHNINLALQMYHDVHGSYPPAYIADADGKPLHSWRVILLPYLDQMPLYQQYRFDEPWDGPNNRKLHGVAMKLYTCPGRSEKQPKTDASYVAVVGSQTIWPGTVATRRADVIDGSSNTILLVETYNSGIHWMEPRDLHMTQMPLAINPLQGQGICSAHVHGAQCGFADGSVRFLTDKLPAETLRAMLTIKGREVVKEL